MRNELSVGDPIEIKHQEFNLENEAQIITFWRPATICFVSEDQLIVAFSTGERLAVSRTNQRHLYRIPRRKK